MKLVCNISPMHGVRSTKLEPNSPFPIPSVFHKIFKCGFSPSNYTRRFSQNFEPEPGIVPYGERGDCQCDEILSSVYSVILEHAASSGKCFLFF